MVFLTGVVFGFSFSMFMLKHAVSHMDIEPLAQRAVQDVTEAYEHAHHDREIESAFQDKFFQCMKNKNDLHHRIYDLETLVDSRKRCGR